MQTEEVVLVLGTWLIFFTAIVVITVVKLKNDREAAQIQTREYVGYSQGRTEWYVQTTKKTYDGPVEITDVERQGHCGERENHEPHDHRSERFDVVFTCSGDVSSREPTIDFGPGTP